MLAAVVSGDFVGWGEVSLDWRCRGGGNRLVRGDGWVARLGVGWGGDEGVLQAWFASAAGVHAEQI